MLAMVVNQRRSHPLLGEDFRQMTRPRRGNSSYSEVYALLWLTRRSEVKIVDFFGSWGIPQGSIYRGMHLTVYYARRCLPGLPQRHLARAVSIEADVKETRFMVLAPGGENPRPELEPAKRSAGIRLTKRNTAIEEIQALRRKPGSSTTRSAPRRTPIHLVKELAHSNCSNLDDCNRKT